MSPPKVCYKATDRACDLSSMTFVIVLVRKQETEQKKEIYWSLLNISQTAHGKVIYPRGEIVGAGSEKWEFLQIYCSSFQAGEESLGQH